MFRRKRDPLSFIQRLEALPIQKGDVVLITVPAHLTPQQLQGISDAANAVFSKLGAAATMVIAKGMDITFVRGVTAEAVQATEAALATDKPVKPDMPPMRTESKWGG